MHNRTRSRRGLERVLIAGGGTGGHLFPGIAVACALRRRWPAVRILFVGTSRPVEVHALARAGFDHRAIPASGLKGRGRAGQVCALGQALVAVFRAARILARFDPQTVLGVGGYVSGPVVAAAWLRRVPVAIHEQNSLPGLTNRWLARLADCVLVSFADACGRFPAAKTVLTGNPVRRQLLDRPAVAATAGRPRDRFTVLVLGGSQGAHRVNVAASRALVLLGGRRRVRIIHQTGADDVAWVREVYRKAGADARVEVFFDDMAACYAAADVIVTRAGATTVAEITALGKAALFVPYPFAADDHQTVNARSLCTAGAARLLPESALSAGGLADELDDLARDPHRLADMGRRAGALGRPQAAEAIVAHLQHLARRRGAARPAGGHHVP